MCMYFSILVNGGRIFTSISKDNGEIFTVAVDFCSVSLTLLMAEIISEYLATFSRSRLTPVQFKDTVPFNLPMTNSFSSFPFSIL